MSGRCLAGIRVLDLKAAAGRAAFLDLVDRADARIDGAPPAPRAPFEERAAEDLLAAWKGN